MNFGVWNAAVATAPALQNNHGVRSVVWTPSTNASAFPKSLTERVSEVVRVQGNSFAARAEDLSGQSTEVLFVSHGAWRSPTRWGLQAKKLGFRWVYTPQGMLEPWSLSQKKWRKKAAYALFEKRAAKEADLIRAVSQPEQINLGKLGFGRVELIPNGIPSPPFVERTLQPAKPKILFLGRLHKKKGIRELVQAFVSQPDFSERCELIIGGPDDGEASAVQDIIHSSDSKSIKLLGPVFGKEKEKLLADATFFILPSHSEGFPTSVVEAMGYGCVPIISEGCNFPQAEEQGLIVKVEPNIRSIVRALSDALSLDWNICRERSEKSRRFISDHYTVETIAASQNEIFRKLL